MDDFLTSRYRTVGILTVLVIVAFFLVLLFVQYREKKNISMRLRVFYSDIVQSLLISKNMNGMPGEWGWKPGYKNVNLLNGNFFNYLKVEENCAQAPGTCMPNVAYKSIKEKETNINLYNFPSVRLRNGISLAVETIGKCKRTNQACALVYVDLNNVEEPNAFGKDLFVFTIINSGTVAFLPYDSYLSKDKLKDDINYGCNKISKIAMYCSGYLAKNDWIIDKDYPW